MPGRNGIDLDSMLETATRMADAAAQVTLRHFRSATLDHSNKKESSFDPVTVADQGAEDAMRDILATERPDDGIYGEERARTHGSSGLTWILDPIDGTRAYISGVPVWGTLIALDDGKRGRIGVIDQPYIGERFIGVPGDRPLAQFHRHGAINDLVARECPALDQATLFTTDPYLFLGEEADAFASLRQRVRLTRYGTDCYAYALLAAGQIDLVVESGLAAYDVASHVPLIQAAGGVITDWQGGDCRWGGRVVAAGDPRVHEQALEVLSQVS